MKTYLDPRTFRDRRELRTRERLLGSPAKDTAYIYVGSSALEAGVQDYSEAGVLVKFREALSEDWIHFLRAMMLARIAFTVDEVTWDTWTYPVRVMQHEAAYCIIHANRS